MLDVSLQHPRSVLCFLLVPIVTFGASGCGAPERTDTEPTGETQEALAPNSTAGFVWTQDSTGSFDADPDYSYNSAGGTNHIQLLAGTTGQYRVDFPQLGSTRGNVEVTAYGSGSERCKVVDWNSTTGGTLRVFVNCYAWDGTPVNTQFVVDYQRRTDTPGVEGAYVWANNSSSTSYTPSANRRWNSTGQPITITHTAGTGTYVVSIGGQTTLSLVGAMQVTAFGDSNSFCDGSAQYDINQVVSYVVKCFDGTTHQPVESQFDLIVSKKSPNNIQSYMSGFAQRVNVQQDVVNDMLFTSGYLFACNDSAGQPIGIVPPAPTFTNTYSGQYTVRFPWMAFNNPAPSNVMVTIGNDSASEGATCKVVRWWNDGIDAYVVVDCFESFINFMSEEPFWITYSSFGHAACGG